MTVYGRFPRLVLAAASIGFVFAVEARSAEVTIEPSHDNSLFADGAGQSCGYGPLFCGQTGSFGVRRALVAFDVAARVPAGSTVTSVELLLTVTGSGPGSSVTNVFTLHRVQADWGEELSPCSVGTGAPAVTGDATWVYRHYATQAWSQAGGDFVAAASGSVAMSTGGPATFPSQPGMIADVQTWLDQPSGNFGWIMLGAESVNRSAREFYSREGAVPPSLHIVFTPPVVSPPAVPDGVVGSPVLLGKLSANGANLLVSWDTTTCDGDVGYHIVYGISSGFPATISDPYALVGSVCGLGASSPFAWNGSPDPASFDPANRLIWMLVVASNSEATEGSWGRSSAPAERNGPGTNGCSGQCGVVDKSVSNTCGIGF